MDLNWVKNFIENEIPFLKKVGISVEDISRGKIKLKICYDSTNLNHFGSYQAGVYMTFAEAAGAALLSTILDLSDTLLLTKECRVKFGDPAKNSLIYKGRFKNSEINDLSDQLKKHRKTNFSMKVVLYNENNCIAAEAELIYYLRIGSSAIIHSQSNKGATYDDKKDK